MTSHFDLARITAFFARIISPKIRRESEDASDLLP